MMLFGAFGFAQHPDLLEVEWYLEEVTIEGITYQRPEANFQAIGYFWSNLFEVAHLGCHEGFGAPVSYSGNDTFNLVDSSVILLGDCTDPVILLFMDRHYNLYLLNNNFARNPFTYTITPGPNGNTLVVTNGDGDVGVYGDVLLSSSDHTLDVILIYPNPTRDEVFISGLTEKIGYSLYTVLGVQVSKGIVGNNEPITTSDLQSGLYILQLEDGRTGRIVIE